MSVAGDLRKAQEILERHGWCQGHLTNPSGQVCLEGAILSASRGDLPGLNYRAALDVVRGVLIEEGQIEAGHPAVFEWNDRPERTVEDVKLLLKRSIEYAEEQGL